MTESAVNNSSTGKNPARKNKIIGWFRTSAFKCVLMDVVTFALILIIFFLICFLSY